MLHVDQNIFWTVVNLLILFILLRIFLFKPVLGMIEKRKAAIEGTLSDADQKNAAAQALKQQYESSLKDAKQESFQIVSDAKDRAQVQYNQIIDKVLKDAQSELASVALAAASKLLGTTVDAKANKAMLDAFLAEAGDAK